MSTDGFPQLSTATHTRRYTAGKEDSFPLIPIPAQNLEGLRYVLSTMKRLQ